MTTGLLVGSYKRMSMKYYPPHVLLPWHMRRPSMHIQGLCSCDFRSWCNKVEKTATIEYAHEHHNTVELYLPVVFELPSNKQQTSVPRRNMMLRFYIRLPLLELRIRFSASLGLLSWALYARQIIAAALLYMSVSPIRAEMASVKSGPRHIQSLQLVR